MMSLRASVAAFIFARSSPLRMICGSGSLTAIGLEFSLFVLSLGLASLVAGLATTTPWSTEPRREVGADEEVGLPLVLAGRDVTRDEEEALDFNAMCSDDLDFVCPSQVAAA